MLPTNLRRQSIVAVVTSTFESMGGREGGVEDGVQEGHLGVGSSAICTRLPRDTENFLARVGFHLGSEFEELIDIFTMTP